MQLRVKLWFALKKRQEEASYTTARRKSHDGPSFPAKRERCVAADRQFIIPCTFATIYSNTHQRL